MISLAGERGEKKEAAEHDAVGGGKEGKRVFPIGFSVPIDALFENVEEGEKKGREKRPPMASKLRGSDKKKRRGE